MHWDRYIDRPFLLHSAHTFDDIFKNISFNCDTLQYANLHVLTWMMMRMEDEYDDEADNEYDDDKGDGDAGWGSSSGV